jgi:hypothetical protein
MLLALYKGKYDERINTMITTRQADKYIKSGVDVKMRQINYPDEGIFTVKIISRDKWSVVLSDGAKISRDELEIVV